MAERFSRFSFGTKVYAEWRIIVEKENIITIHALGDSLVTAYGDDESNFIGGWGDHLWSFFDPGLCTCKCVRARRTKQQELFK